MDTSTLNQIIFVLFFFILSAFFSASEVALFSIDEKKLQLIAKRKPYAARIISRLLELPRKILITILIGNNIANVGISIILAILTIRFAESYGINKDVLLTIEIIVLTVILLLVGEIIPKIIANRFPVEVILVGCYPLYYMFTLLSPITYLFVKLSQIPQKQFSIDKSKMAINVKEIRALADLSKEYGALEKDEHDLIHSIIEFGETTVKEVMTNRTEMISAEINESFESILKKFLNSHHSRIPIYQDNIDNIEGFLYIKDLLPVYYNLKLLKDQSQIEDFNIQKILRPALFVPESKKIDDMFREFQKKNVHIAIVVDEFGGTAGLITMEDIISEVVSRLSSSDEVSEYYKKVGENSYLIDARIPISDLEELLNIRLKTEESDYDTLGGFLLEKFGDLPEKNSTIEFENYLFTIQDVTEKSIKRVLVTHSKK